MNSITKKDNYKFAYQVIEMLFNLGKEHAAYMEKSYSLDNILEYLENPANKGATMFNKNKFSKLTYAPFYRKRSSSGKIAKTSIVETHFQTFSMSDKNGTEIEAIQVKWPYHLHRKEYIVIPLNSDVNLVEMEDKGILMTIEELEKYSRKIYATTVYNLLRQNLKSFGIDKVDFMNFSEQEIKDQVSIKEMMGV